MFGTWLSVLTLRWVRGCVRLRWMSAFTLNMPYRYLNSASCSSRLPHPSRYSYSSPYIECKLSLWQPFYREQYISMALSMRKISYFALFGQCLGLQNVGYVMDAKWWDLEDGCQWKVSRYRRCCLDCLLFPRGPRPEPLKIKIQATFLPPVNIFHLYL